MPPKSEDTEFLALLVHHGHLSKESAISCFQQLESGKQTLDQILLSQGFSKEKISRLRKTRAGELPEIPGFQIEERLGAGATAEVFRATEIKTGKPVAIKVLRSELAQDIISRTRFLREAKMLLELQHDSVVKGFRVAKTHPPDAPEGPAGDMYLLIMEFIPGSTLLDLVAKNKTFAEEDALYIVLQAARGLEYLRSQGMVHRDIKPGNIMITPDNRVKLIDLGFASSAGETDTMRKDTTVGTVQYISPEQAQGIRDLDSRADIYSLGVTLYHLVIGELPFTGKEDSEVLRKQVMESLSSAALKGRKISPHLHYFIEKMMAKEREIRYQNPQELIADIETQIQGRKSLEFDPQAKNESTLQAPKDLFGKKPKDSR